MKKLKFLIILSYLLVAQPAFAQGEGVFGKISPPKELEGLNPGGGGGATGINNLLDRLVGLFFAAGAMAFIIMFVWGAVAMILSGGDKEAVAKARARITWAIIGVVLLASTYLILSLLQYITGIQLFL